MNTTEGRRVNFGVAEWVAVVAALVAPITISVCGVVAMNAQVIAHTEMLRSGAAIVERQQRLLEALDARLDDHAKQLAKREEKFDHIGHRLTQLENHMRDKL